MTKSDKNTSDPRKEQEGDVLGISHPTAGSLPEATHDPSSHPRGIDVREEAHGHNLKAGFGATSIDMGAGGSGNAIKSDDKD